MKKQEEIQPDMGGALSAIVSRIYERFPAASIRRLIYKIMLNGLVDNGFALPDVDTPDLVYQEVCREMAGNG